MMKTISALMFGAVVATGLIATHAFAAPAGPAAAPIAAQNNLYQEADMNLSIGVGGGYNRYRHGNRCSYSRYGCENFYQGYYYQNPWWLGRGIVIGNAYGNRRGRNHIAWCSDRYRSYDIRSDSWLSNSGQRRRCNSPY